MKHIKLFLLAILMLVLVATLLSCGGDKSPEEYTQTLDENATPTVRYQKIEGKEEYRAFTWGIGAMNAHEIVISSTCNGLPVTEIGEGAFKDRGSLAVVKLPKSIKKIGANAFTDCPYLRDVYYEGTLTDWCEITFECSPLINGAFFHPENAEDGISDLIIPEGVERIPPLAFAGMYGGGEILFPSTLNAIGGSAFTKVGFDQLIIPDTLTTIEPYAFSGTNIKNVVFGTGVTYLGKGAFHSSESLTSVSFKGSGVTLGEEAFYGCTALRDVDLTGVYHIQFSVFYGCTSLYEIRIPESVAQIDNKAFGASGLNRVYFDVPNTWLVGAKRFDEELLGNAESAAKYLKKGYTNNTWTRC